MGKYINIGNAEFESVRKDEYVDKSMLIAYVNKVLGTQRKFLCVTRARRFGKSIAAKMLNAYYDESVNSHALFQDLNIAKDPSYDPHLNKYPVIYLDASGFTSELTSDRQRVVHEMNDALSKELLRTYPDVPFEENDTLPGLLLSVVGHTKKQFIMIVDEWDAVLKEYAGILLDHVGSVLLVGINYDKKTKKHECVIEKGEVATQRGEVSQKRGEVATQRGEVNPKLIKLIIAIHGDTLSLKQIMERLQLRGDDSFRKRYLLPAQEENYVAKLYPDAANSSKQRYYLTDKGIELLKQLNAN